MKKLFTTVAFVLCSMSLMAKDYTCPLVVTLNGEAAGVPEDVPVDVTKQDNGKYTLTLKNFVLGGYMPVGTIVVTDVDATTIGSTDILTTQKNITITAGDDSALPEGWEDGWLGPKLGQVPILMQGKLKGDNFESILNIAFGELNIGVQLGNIDEFGQLPNAGFENFHTATVGSNTSDEPNAWHSFMTSTGTLKDQVNKVAHTFIDKENKRPGSTGTTSVRVESGIVETKVAFATIKTPANGTITTGCLQAGSVIATDSKNCSYLDISNTSIDGNGDPFYSIMTNKPDAVEVWVKYYQGAKQQKANCPYATISAAITDGTYYQDPTGNTTYKNVVATAKNEKIEHTNEWQKITADFKYTDSTVPAKAILVTMSTNATPGAASKDANDPDKLWVDDINFIYNHDITSITYNGQEVKDKDLLLVVDKDNLTTDDFNVKSNGVGAFISKMLVKDEDNPSKSVLYVTATSNDLKEATTKDIEIYPASESFTTMDYGYATYSAGIPVAFPTTEGVNAYTVTLEGNTLKYNKIEGTVPECTALLLRAKDKGEATYKLPYSEATAGNFSNSLKVSDGKVVGDGSTIYVLSDGSNGVGFYRLSNGVNVPARKCYLKISKSASAKPSFFAIDNETTGINHIENATGNVNDEPMFNLAGQKVNNNYKGIVVVNGKKMINK